MAKQCGEISWKTGLRESGIFRYKATIVYRIIIAGDHLKSNSSYIRFDYTISGFAFSRASVSHLPWGEGGKGGGLTFVLSPHVGVNKRSCFAWCIYHAIFRVRARDLSPSPLSLSVSMNPPRQLPPTTTKYVIS